MPPHLVYRQILMTAIAMLALMVGGCTRWNTDVPYFQTQTPPPISETGEVVAPDRWWLSFSDPILDRQVNLALANNNDIAAAYDRLSAARALVCREASDLWPDLNGVAGSSGNFGPGENRNNFQWGLDASYQVDIWGQIESRVDAFRLRADATDADYHAIALTISAEVVRTWFALIEAHAQVQLLQDQIETNRTGLTLQQARFDLGLIRIPDVLRQQQLLESTLEQSVVAESRIELLEHRLAILLGRMPQTAKFTPGTVLPDLPPLPDTGISSQLLNRRPDVRRDHLAVRAADRDLASAITAQFPRFNLSGSLVNATEKPENLFRDWFASLAGQLIAPLFDGGQRRAEVDRTAAVLRQRFDEYAQTVLIAFGEVEDSLAQEKYQRERIEHLEEQVRLAGQASEQLREQYITDEAEYLDVLSAIQAQQGLQRRLLSARLELILVRVSLYLALAGGFDPSPVLNQGEYMLAVEEGTATSSPTEPRPELEEPETNSPADESSLEINPDERSN